MVGMVLSLRTRPMTGVPASTAASGRLRFAAGSFETDSEIAAPLLFNVGFQTAPELKQLLTECEWKQGGTEDGELGETTVLQANTDAEAMASFLPSAANATDS